MVDNIIKNSNLFGEGWAFTERNEGKKLDLSKFEINKGYFSFVQHFGVTDPLIGGIEGPFWYDDRNIAEYVLKTLGIAKEWTDYIKSTYENEDVIINDFEDALDYVYMLKSIPEEIGEFCVEKGYLHYQDCLFGVTDEEYFEELIKDSFSDDEQFYDTVESGMIEFGYFE